jgi:hypothetical protein
MDRTQPSLTIYADLPEARSHVSMGHPEAVSVTRGQAAVSLNPRVTGSGPCYTQAPVPAASMKN